jgi:hypothetical protein
MPVGHDSPFVKGGRWSLHPRDEEILTSQTGRIGERAIISLVTAADIGLRIARPCVDDHGVDLLAFVEGIPFTVALQPKTDTSPAPGGGLSFIFHLDEIPRRGQHYFGIGLSFDAETGEVGPVSWLIPAADLLRGHRKRGDWLIQVSTRAGAGGKWGRFRLPTQDLPGAIRSLVDALDPSTPSRGV